MGDQNTTMYYTSPGYRTSQTPTTTTRVSTTTTTSIGTTTKAFIVISISTSSSTIVVPVTTKTPAYTTETAVVTMITTVIEEPKSKLKPHRNSKPHWGSMPEWKSEWKRDVAGGRKAETTTTTTIYDHSATETTTQTSTFVFTSYETVTFIHPTTDTIHATTVHEHATTTTATEYSVVTKKPKPTRNAAIALGVPSWLKLQKQGRQVLPASHALEVMPYSSVATMTAKTLPVDEMSSDVVEDVMEEEEVIASEFVTRLGTRLSAMPQATDFAGVVAHAESVLQFISGVTTSLNARESSVLREEIDEIRSELVEAFTAHGNAVLVPAPTTVTVISSNAAVGLRAPTLLAGLRERKVLAKAPSWSSYPHVTVSDTASATESQADRTFRGSLGFTFVAPPRETDEYAARAIESVYRADSSRENARRSPAPDATLAMSNSPIDEDKAAVRSMISSLYGDIFLDEAEIEAAAPMTTNGALAARDNLDEALSSLLGSNVVCNERKKLPWAERVVQGIDYLRDIKKDITVEPCTPAGLSLGTPSIDRHRSCIWTLPDGRLGDDSDLFNCQSTRVSCSHKTAIFIVNCNMKKAVNTTSDFIADKASEILSTCCYGRRGTDYCANARLDKKLGMKSGGLWKNEAEQWYVDVRSTHGLGDNC